MSPLAIAGESPSGIDPSAATSLPSGTVSSQRPLQLIIWMLGLFVLALICWSRHGRLLGILSRSREVDSHIREEAELLAAKLGVTACPEIRISDERIGPFVTVRLRRQAIVFPTSLLAKMSTEERQTVLAHELAHVRSGDRWIRSIEVLVLGLYWWNPIAWFVGRRLRQSMEECCDAVVIWIMPENRKSYGKALLRTVEFLTESRPLQPLPGNAFGPPRLKHRIENIMKRENSPLYDEHDKSIRPVNGDRRVAGCHHRSIARKHLSRRSRRSHPTIQIRRHWNLLIPAAQLSTRGQFVGSFGNSPLIRAAAMASDKKVVELLPESTFATFKENRGDF